VMGGCSSTARHNESLKGHGSSKGIADGETPTSFAGPHSDIVNCVASSDMTGEWISGADDGTLSCVSWSSCRVLESWVGHSKSINRVIAAPTINGLLFSGSRDSSVRIWDVSESRCISSRHLSRNVVTCAASVPGEPLVWQGSEDLRLRLWDTRILQPAATLEGYVYFPLTCAADGNICLTGSNGFDGSGCELRIWDRRMLKQLLVFDGHQHAVRGVAFLSCKGSNALRFASASKDGSVCTWQIIGGDGNMESSSFLPSGATSLAAAVDHEQRAQLYASTLDGAVHALRTEFEADGDAKSEVSIVVSATGSDLNPQ